MAGQIPLGTRYYPGDFQLSTFTTHAPTHGKYPILYVDRTIVVDSISFMLEEAPNQNITVKVVSVPWPNVPNFNTPITGQVDITNSISLGTGDTYPKARVTGDSSGFAINTANNLIPMANGLWILASSDFSGVSGNLNVGMRWRSTF